MGNSGIWIPEEAAVARMTDDQWHRTMRENVDSMFFTTRAAARVLNDMSTELQTMVKRFRL